MFRVLGVYNFDGALDLEDFTCVVFSHLEVQKVPEIFGLRDFSPIILQEFFHSFVPVSVANRDNGCKHSMKEYMASPTYVIFCCFALVILLPLA